MSEGGEHERRKERTGKPSPLHNDPVTLLRTPCHATYATLYLATTYVGIVFLSHREGKFSSTHGSDP